MQKRDLDTCVHCGFCLPSCPTYQSWGEEMDSPRGRIYLMKSLADGKEGWSSTVAQHFDRCLGCMACVTACPSGVKYDALLERTRADLERHFRRRVADRLFRGLLFALLPYPRRLRWLLLLQLLYVKTGLCRIVHALGIQRLLPPRLRQLEALMPPLAWRQLAAKPVGVAVAAPARRARVALLAGCVQRVYFPSVNEATVRVLGAEGCEVVVPSALGCCGALSLHSGREEEARRLARAAIETLEHARVDAVIVNAAGCGSAMKEWRRLLAGDKAWEARAAAIAAKVRDVSELLVALGPRAPRHPLALRAAYHDACHLAHAQRVRAEPRMLLGTIPALELVEIADADQCCGSAGVYNLLEPASAREIGRRKANNVLAASPQLLVSANPGCTLQISMLLRERGQHVPTAHPIELLDASIRGITWPTTAE
jgi:glycolate oxidase iron-sulfur subunit